METKSRRLMRQLCEVQRYKLNRNYIHSWAQDLKFLTGGPSSKLDTTVAKAAQSYFQCNCKWEDRHKPDKVLTSCTCRCVARPFDPPSKIFSLVRLPRCLHYVAISYRWKSEPIDDGVVIVRDGQGHRASVRYLYCVYCTIYEPLC